MLEYGYQIVNGQIIPDPLTSQAVIEMHALYLKSLTMKKVIEYLNASPFYSPLGNKKWTRSTVRNILGNPVYKGNEYLPRILPDEIVDQVAETFIAKQQKRTSKKVIKPVLDILPNVICTHCKNTMLPFEDCPDFHICTCGNSVATSFIKEAFVNLVDLIHQNSDYIEHFESESQWMPEVASLSQQIEEALKQPSYSNFNLVEMLKERASLTYACLEPNKLEMESLRLQNIFYSIKDVETFDINLFSSIIRSVIVENASTLTFELTNTQQFEINLQD